MTTNKTFKGAKIAAIFKGQILVYKRDNIAEISFPNYWDFPGGGRENNESPEACVLRELHEEFGLLLSLQRLHYKRRVPSQTGIGYAYFFATYLTETETQKICFGSEGQYWGWMDFQTYLEHESAIPANQHRLKQYLTEN